MRIFKNVAFASAALLLAVASTNAKANVIVNGTFAPATNPYPGYGAIPGWQGYYNGLPNNGNVGSNTSSGPFWNNGSTGGTSTVGFIQSATYNPDDLAQSINLIVGDTYEFSFLENARAGYTSPTLTAGVRDPTPGLPNDGLDILYSGVVNPVGGNNPFIMVNGSFVATASVEFFGFEASSPAGTDATALITNVNVAPVPEPNSLMLLGTGIVGVAGAIRRRLKT